MRIKSIKLKNVKSFDLSVTATFDENTKLFAFSGTNGAGKSTLLRMAWLIQKAHFIELDGSVALKAPFIAETLRYLTAKDSRADLTLDVGGNEVSIWIERINDSYTINYSDKAAVITHWMCTNSRICSWKKTSSNKLSTLTTASRERRLLDQASHK